MCEVGYEDLSNQLEDKWWASGVQQNTQANNRYLWKWV